MVLIHFSVDKKVYKCDSRIRAKSGLVVSKLDSQLEGRGFETHPLLDGNGVKNMPGFLVHSIIEKKEKYGYRI